MTTALMALTCWATRSGQSLQQEARRRRLANPQNTSVRMHSATRVHEAGITSNRGSACHGECVPGSCTHRPSHHGSGFYLKAGLNPANGIVSDWGEVVIKVAVGEPAAGLPPFYDE